jgi:hypothetical protein
MHLYDSELELNNMIYLLSVWFDFSNNIHLFMLFDRPNYQAPSVESSCGDLVLCSANSSSELYSKLVIIANCEEAPTFSD